MSRITQIYCRAQCSDCPYAHDHLKSLRCALRGCIVETPRKASRRFWSIRYHEAETLEERKFAAEMLSRIEACPASMSEVTNLKAKRSALAADRANL